MPRPKKPGAPEPKRRSRNGCWPCKARKVKCGEEHPTCINCQKTGETCDYSVRLNWEGRRTKRSLSFGIATETAQSPKAPVQFQPSSFSHTFPISNSVPQIRPKPTIRRSQTAPQSVEPGKRKLEPLGALEDYPNKVEPDSLHAIPRRQAQTLAPSPMSAQHTVDSFTSMPSFHQTVPEDTGILLIAHKRTRSLAESSDSGGPRQYSYISSPASLTGSSPPVSRLRSRTGSTSVGSPLTPVSLVFRSEDDTRSPILSLPSPVSPGSSRLSVNYLLSGSPRTPYGRSTSVSLSSGTPLGSETTEGGADEADEAVFYGYDHGIRDTDINHNDDFRAISQMTTYVPHDSAFPVGVHNKEPWRFELTHATSVGDGYYSQPVPIWIPHNLQPLPPKLRDNSMNLLYFHHFLSHTAKVLVPYDDPKSNPFRTVLPQMAVRNDHLLSLLLAYSAAHRARLLGQKEPQMRIALWVQDIFPALRQALNDKEQIISNTSLATAIMLASLEIISPTAFGYDIPWQRHLSLARDLMWRRLADLRRTAHRLEEDRVCAFLWSWFAYLDVLGCLSGGTPDEDSSRFWLLEYMMHGASDDRYEIDCIMGFTTSCVQILAQIADLARRCDEQRFTSSTPSPSAWTPAPVFVQRAKLLEQELLYSMNEPSLPCKHIQSVGAKDRQAMVLMNEAFHWAGLIHLHRRVLSKPSGHADVQEAVRSIIVCLESIQPGGSAETGFLFPMFTAGCNALHEDQRSKILERFKSVETNGMTQVHKAKNMMENVWASGQAWEPLLCTEFIG